MLHIYRDSHYPSSNLERCLCQMGKEDVLLLIEDGVYLTQYSILALKKLAEQNQVFILIDDTDARGLHIKAPYQSADMAKWISLSTEHDKSLTW